MNRREFVSVTGAVGSAVSVSGCLGLGGSGSESFSGYEVFEKEIELNTEIRSQVAFLIDSVAGSELVNTDENQEGAVEEFISDTDFSESVLLVGGMVGSNSCVGLETGSVEQTEGEIKVVFSEATPEDEDVVCSEVLTEVSEMVRLNFSGEILETSVVVAGTPVVPINAEDVV